MEAAFRDAVPGVGSLTPVAPPMPLWNEWLGHARLPSGVYLRRHAIDWRHGSLVFGAAWWSDLFGRKHWLIQAESDRDPQGIGRLATPEGGSGLIDDVHPLEWIAPPLAVGYRGEPPQLVVVCRCGFAGTPESLAWVGTTCGPCFDREQDGLPPAEGLSPARPDLGLFANFELTHTQDVITCANNELLFRHWKPPWTGPATWHRHWHQEGPWAVSLSVAHGGLMAVGVGNRVLLVSLRDGRTLATRDVGGVGHVVGLAFAGHQGQRLVVGFQSTTHAARSFLRVWEVTPEGQFGEPLYLVEVARVARFEAVSLKGQRLLMVTNPRSIEVRDTSTGEIVDRLKIPNGGRFRTARFLPDGSVVGSTHMDDRNPPRLHRWSAEGRARVGLLEWLRGSLGRDPETSASLSSICHGLAVAPEGKSLACVEGGGIVRRDASTLAEQARFRPVRTAMLPHLAFSADGQLLVQTERGLAVWPWRELFG
jgi:hypothetical protein